MTLELYIATSCVFSAASLWLLLRNRELKSEALALSEQDERSKSFFKEESRKFDKLTADLRLEIKFKNERLEDWSKTEQLRTEELAKDKQILRERVVLRDGEVAKARKELLEEKEAKKKVLSQKKSGEVRLGHIAEKLAPFLEDFTYDPSNATFLGQPIDYIVFEDEEIVFVEIKSGNAKLSPKQKHIKELIENNCVSWKEIRID
jgi:predicted Holliday junction resolvase-like endonuclease